MKYNWFELRPGNKVRLTDIRPSDWNINGLMDMYLGKIVTIKTIIPKEPPHSGQFLVEKDYGDNTGGWLFNVDDIVEVIATNQDSRTTQIKLIANVIDNMHTDHYCEDMNEWEYFTEECSNNIAEALYDAGCRIYTKEQLELYKFYDIEEARYQRQLAREKKEAELNKTNRERAARCEDCTYSRIFSCGDGFKFLGCFHKPYKGRWCIEIENCPKKETEINKYI